MIPSYTNNSKPWICYWYLLHDEMVLVALREDYEQKLQYCDVKHNSDWTKDDGLD